LPKKFKATELNEAEASAVDLLEAYSATVGILLKQDGVGYHRPFYQKNLTETKANGLDVDFGRPLTTEEMVELGELYIKETGDPYASPISTPQGVRFINFNVGDAEADLRRFRERVRSIRNPAEKRAMQGELRKRSAALGKTNKKFQQDIRRVLEQADLPDGVATLFTSYNGYLGNNWTEKKNGENYLQESRLAQRPDLQQRVRDLVSQLDPRIKAVENEFADKYGWSPREDLNTAYRARPASPEIKDIDTEVIEPRRTIDPEQADQAIDKNIASIAESPTGVPRFSVKASPEAQYIAQNPDSALDADEPMFAVRGEIPAVDKLTKGPDREAPNGRVFMDATNTGSLGTILTKLKAGALNRYAALEKYYQNVPELRELEAESSAIAAALFSDRSKAILASAVKYGVPVYRDGLTRVEEFTHDGDTYRGLIGVMSLIYNKDVGDLRKLAQAYAMVQRGDYLKGKNKLTPVDAKSKKEVLDAVDALTDADGYNPVKKWHEVWSAYNNRTIDFLKATGILNEQTADIWRASSYIPFYRKGVSEDDLPKVASNVFGDLTRMSEFRAYQGSDKAVDVGLIESVVLNLSTAIDMGMKNITQQRITRDMQRMGLARQIRAKGAIPKGVNAIDFKVNGNKVRFEIDDNLIFDSMTIQPSGTVEQLATKYLGMPSNVLRELVTRDPGFMMANMMRDTLSTWTTSGASFVPVIDTVKGLSDGVERLEKLGVVGGYDFSIDKQDIVKFYEAENKRRTEQMNPLNMFTRIWDWAGKATTASDAATRNAVYNDVLARTGNEAEAAFQAMEIINFARRGSHPLARVLTAAIPFLNARFQGLDVFMRATLGNYSTRRDQPPAMGQLKLAYRGGILAGLTALYYLMVGEEDWYKEQDDYVREMNWLAPTDSGVPIKFPIPFEVGLIFKTIPEAILANTIGDQSDRELRQTLQRGLVSTLEVNPLGVQAISPLVEASLNHSFLTGRPIVPYYVDKMTPGLTGNANTSQIATDIAKVLPISPLKIDHVMSGYTGTIGAYIITATDSLYRTATGADDKRPAKNMYEFPLWRRFFASKEGSGLRSDAYDLYNDVNEVIVTMNSLRKDGRIDELNAYLASRQHLLQLKEPVYTLKRQLDNVRQQKRRIIASDMDDEAKRKMIDDLDANLNEYLKVVPRLKGLADAPFIQTTF
ncbi:MAG: LPD38 domain-containing protein, partial [Halieaceae bacterium]